MPPTASSKTTARRSSSRNAGKGSSVTATNRRPPQKRKKPEPDNLDNDEEEEEESVVNSRAESSQGSHSSSASTGFRHSPSTMQEILHPGGQNNVTPMLHSPEDSMRQSIAELHDDAVKNREAWVASDITTKVKARACKVIWTICKIPRFTASGDGTTENFIRQYVRGELPDLPTKLFDKKWPMIKSAITEALRTKRAGVVQDMKRKFLGMPPLGARIRLK
jgi:hypothetical protein